MALGGWKFCEDTTVVMVLLQALLMASLVDVGQGLPRPSKMVPCADQDDPVSTLPGTTLEAHLATIPAHLPPRELERKQEKAVRLGCVVLETIRKEQFKSKRLWKYMQRLKLDLDVSTFVEETHIKEDDNDIHQTLHAFQEYVSIIFKDLKDKKNRSRTKAALGDFTKAVQSLRCVYVVASDTNLGDWRVPPELRKVKDGAFRSIRDYVVVKSIVQYVAKLMGGTSRCRAA